MNRSALRGPYEILAEKASCCLLFSVLILFPTVSLSEPGGELKLDPFFVVESGISLQQFGDQRTRRLLTRIKGRGEDFGLRETRRYCRLKKDSRQVQWVLNDLETGEVISKSANADKRFFGASLSKLFVGAALLHKQNGTLSRNQLNDLVQMIVVSDNHAWKELQRQVGEDGTDDSGREAVQKFVLQMGYTNTKGFQGWLRKKDGTRIHGNELNALELSQFLHDTYRGKYEGAKILWKIMHAARTGKEKVDKYTPSYLYIGGKTGTYSGPNESPDTVKHRTIRARNHAAVLSIKDKHYGLSILTNTGRNEDVAVLGGGLMREYLGIEERLACS